MNERIKELMAECNYVVDGTCHTTREEKFAELIIKECIAVSHLQPNSTKNDEWQKGYAKGQMDSSLLIKTHFGVK